MANDDTESPLFSLLAKLDLTLDGFKQSIDREAARVQRKAGKIEQPRIIPFHASVIMPASGFAVVRMDNGGPDQGNYWNVRKLVIGGLTTTTVAAGRADVFVSAGELRNVTTLAQVGIQDWEDQAAALPYLQHYGPGELTLRHNEELYVIISGATALQQYVVRGRAINYQEGTDAQEWSL